MIILRNVRGLCIACVIVAGLGGACGTSGHDSGASDEQTTTTLGSTTTIDLVALNATWSLSGSWLIHDPGDSDGDVRGFASFNPQVNGDRYVSIGYGRCFLFGGRAVESDGLTQIVQIEGALDPLVECDPGPAAETYRRVIECLQTACRLNEEGEVMRLSHSTGQPVADLTRTAGEIPTR